MLLLCCTNRETPFLHLRCFLIRLLALSASTWTYHFWWICLSKKCTSCIRKVHTNSTRLGTGSSAMPHGRGTDKRAQLASSESFQCRSSSKSSFKCSHWDTPSFIIISHWDTLSFISKYIHTMRVYSDMYVCSTQFVYDDANDTWKCVITTQMHARVAQGHSRSSYHNECTHTLE